jgi:hypothetical protein
MLLSPVEEEAVRQLITSVAPDLPPSWPESAVLHVLGRKLHDRLRDRLRFSRMANPNFPPDGAA